MKTNEFKKAVEAITGVKIKSSLMDDNSYWLDSKINRKEKSYNVAISINGKNYCNGNWFPTKEEAYSASIEALKAKWQ